MKFILILIALCLTTGAYAADTVLVDRDGVTTPVDAGSLSGVATAAQGAKADSALQPNGDSAALAFTQSGSGASARTLGAKFTETVSIADYGATTASADNSAAIQAAVTFLRTNYGGGTVIIPPGTFKGKYRIQRGVKLKGAGIGASTLKLPDGANTDVVAYNDPTDFAWNWQIEDLTIDGNKSANSSGNGIKLYKDVGTAVNDQNSFINNVVVQNCAQDGLYINGAGVSGGNRYYVGVVHLTGVRLASNNGYGVNAAQYNDSNWQNVIAHHNYLGGIKIIGSGNHHLTNVKTFYNGTGYSGDKTQSHGFQFLTLYNITCTSCESQNDFGYGFYALNAYNIDLKGIVAENAGQTTAGTGIYLDGVTKFHVDGTSWGGTTTPFQDYGIKINGGGDGTINLATKNINVADYLYTGSPTNVITTINGKVKGGIAASDVGAVGTSSVVTSVGSPGSDGNVPTEKAVRSAIAASSGGLSDPGANGVVKRTSLNATSTAGSADIVALFGGGSCAGYLNYDGSCGTPSSMVYPIAGVPSSTGSAWGTSYAVGTGANNLVQLNGSSQLPAVSGALLTNLPSQLTTNTVTVTPATTSGTAATTLNRAQPDLAAASRYRIADVSMTVTTASPNAGASFAALDAEPYYSGTGTLPTLYGGFISPRNTGTGTVSHLKGFTLWMRNTSTGTVGDADYFHAQSPSNAGTWTGTSAAFHAENMGLAGMSYSYGLLVDDQSGSGYPYAIKTGLGVVSFGDKVTATADVTAKTFTPTIPAATTYAATTIIDLSLGDSPSVTLTGNPTLAFSNPKAGQWHRLNLVQDGTGSRTVTWPSTGLVCTWRNTSGHTAPTLLTAASAVDTIVIHTLSTTSAECWAAGNQ